jgi:hypothetical protein
LSLSALDSNSLYDLKKKVIKKSTGLDLDEETELFVPKDTDRNNSNDGGTKNYD